MKASLKLRDDQKPVLRAKIPVSVLGLPFLSGISAGEARELRLDLATAFGSGPTLRLSYHPNDPWNPFTLAVKTGAGALGSPASAAITMAAEFTFVGRGGPRFTIQIKPRIGDFCVRKSTSSPPLPPFGAAVVDHGADGEGPVAVVGFRPENGGLAGKKPNGFAAGAQAATPGGICGLIAGAEVTAKSSLPLGSRTAVSFRWGVKIPPELRSAFVEDLGRADRISGVSLRKLPLLVMSKVSIEHLPGAAAPSKKQLATAAAAEACLSVQRQLAALQVEQGMLRKAVEELRAGLVTSVGDTSDKRWEGDRNQGSASVIEKNAGRSIGRKGDGRVNGAGGGAAAREDVGEELRRALMGTAGAGAGS